MTLKIVQVRCDFRCWKLKVLYRCVVSSFYVGGNWYHGVYENVNIISSRKTTEFKDFPMPDHYPDFPSAAQMRAYLRSYAKHYDLEQHINLNTEVTRVEPVDSVGWYTSDACLSAIAE